jgi:hypothetical protein
MESALLGFIQTVSINIFLNFSSIVFNKQRGKWQFHSLASRSCLEIEPNEWKQSQYIFSLSAKWQNFIIPHTMREKVELNKSIYTLYL